MRTLDQAKMSTERYQKAAKGYRKVQDARRHRGRNITPGFREKTLAESMSFEGGPFHEAKITIRGNAFGCGHSEDYPEQFTAFLTWDEVYEMMDQPNNGYKVALKMKAKKFPYHPPKRGGRIQFEDRNLAKMEDQETGLQGCAKAWERVRFLANLDGQETVEGVALYMLEHADYFWLAKKVGYNRWLHAKIKDYLFNGTI